MSYTPPLDLLIQLDFAPSLFDYWRHNISADNAFVQVCANTTTGISIISYNTTLEDGAFYKDTVFAGFLRDEAHFRQTIEDAGWAPY